MGIPRNVDILNPLSFLRKGYDFIRSKRQEHGSNAVATSLMGMEVVLLGGAEGARLFYDPQKFIRHGAVPKRVQKTLTGENAIHTMDDEAHRRRKAVFLAVTTPEEVEKLLAVAATEWETAARGWEEKGGITLFEEVQRIQCRSVCAWAGVPPEDMDQRAQDFTAMIDAFGAVGPRHWRGKRARSRTEKWMQEVIEQTRKGVIRAEGRPLELFAAHTENGELLSPQMAAIELMNILRPTVAVSYYICFAALALHEHPEYRQRLEADPGFAEPFIKEVRRYYPFAPFMGALVREDFEWKEHRFKKGSMVLLDIYGTNHDGTLWPDPDVFRPERFIAAEETQYNYIPQGGGDPRTGHRCPGESITIETAKLGLHYLVHRLHYTVPEQDLSYSLQRLPTFPKSGFVMNNIRLRR